MPFFKQVASRKISGILLNHKIYVWLNVHVITLYCKNHNLKKNSLHFLNWRWKSVSSKWTPFSLFCCKYIVSAFTLLHYLKTADNIYNVFIVHPKDKDFPERRNSCRLYGTHIFYSNIFKHFFYHRTQRVTFYLWVWIIVTQGPSLKINKFLLNDWLVSGGDSCALVIHTNGSCDTAYILWLVLLPWRPTLQQQVCVVCAYYAQPCLHGCAM